jgi:hypothetical protein
MSFVKELEHLINYHSKENDSNTPDFILARYFENCLSASTEATQQRETWYGRDARPTYSVGKANKPVEPTAEVEPIPCAICGCTGYHKNCGTL